MVAQSELCVNFVKVSCNDSISVGNVKLKISYGFCMQWCRFVLKAAICRVGLSLKQKAEGVEQPHLANRRCQAQMWAVSHSLASYHWTHEREISTCLSAPHHEEVLDSNEVSSSLSWTNCLFSHFSSVMPCSLFTILLPSFGHILIFLYSWPFWSQGHIVDLYWGQPTIIKQNCQIPFCRIAVQPLFHQSIHKRCR